MNAPRYHYEVQLVDRRLHHLIASASVVAVNRRQAIQRAAIDYGWPKSTINAHRARKGDTLLPPVTP